MGLTVHYSLKSPPKSPQKALALIERVRGIAQALPFAHVGEIQVLDDPAILEADVESLRALEGGRYLWVVTGATRSVTPPWSRLGGNRAGQITRYTREQEVRPTQIIRFATLPGEGSESAEFGLALYPKQVQVLYDPAQDRQYQERYTSGGQAHWDFSYHKFRKVHGWDRPIESFREQRPVNTGFGGWHFSDFCKTEPAAAPEHGGVANFVRSHIALIDLIEAAGRLPGLTVQYQDEARYGQSLYTDHPEQEYPSYSLHPGRFDAEALGRLVGNHELVHVGGG